VLVVALVAIAAAVAFSAGPVGLLDDGWLAVKVWWWGDEPAPVAVVLSEPANAGGDAVVQDVPKKLPKRTESFSHREGRVAHPNSVSWISWVKIAFSGFVGSLVFGLIAGLLRSRFPLKFAVPPQTASLFAAPFPLRFASCAVICCAASAILDGVWPLYFAVMSEAVQEGDKQRFMFLIAGAVIWNFALAVIRSLANFAALRLAISWRHSLTMNIHKKYLGSDQVHYQMNCRRTVDNPDQRIACDVGMLVGSIVDYICGGVDNSGKGVVGWLFLFGTSSCVAWHRTVTATKGSTPGYLGPSLSLVTFLLTFGPNYHFATRLTRTQEENQRREGDFRYAHTRIRTFAESVAFYGGESTELASLNRVFSRLWRTQLAFSTRRLPVDFAQTSFWYGCHIISCVISGALAVASPGDVDNPMLRTTTFLVLQSSLYRCMYSLQGISEQTVSFAKIGAYNRRVHQLIQEMDSDGERQLLAAPVISSGAVRLLNADITTPDGRPLLRGLNLELSEGESLVIMGPSGAGKSSVLRVLGGLWPVASGSVHRPPEFNMLFLAQRPYMVRGSIRQQIAYPLWDQWLQQALTDEEVESLMRACSLSEVWEARRAELDDEDIDWLDVLSLGEQQRLQFCRLLWHHQWYLRSAPTEVRCNPFFAVLDEATASMEVAAETVVYTALKERRIGFLSVAHRPTTLQHHEKALVLDRRTGGAEVVPASRLARVAAAQMVQAVESSSCTTGPLHNPVWVLGSHQESGEHRQI